MAFCYKNFDPSKISVAPPSKAAGEHDYVTWKVTYGGGKFRYFSPDSLTGTRISDDKLKPGQLSQGFHLDENNAKMISIIDETIFAGILKHKGHADTPSYLADCETTDDIRKLIKFIKVKPLLYRPKKKDPKTGKPTKEIDPTIAPLTYSDMIQYGAKHPEFPNKVLTKYTDIRLLDAQNKNKERVERGQPAIELNEANYSFDAQALFKLKTAMKGKPFWEIQDVFGSPTTFKIRQSLTEVFIVNFEASESAPRKEMRDVLIQTGEKIEGPKLTLPSAPSKDDDGDEHHSGSDEEHHSNPLPIPTGTGEFKVQIL